MVLGFELCDLIHVSFTNFILIIGKYIDSRSGPERKGMIVKKVTGRAG